MVGESWSGRAAVVSVMQTANLWDRDDSALAGAGDWARDRRVFGERSSTPRRNQSRVKPTESIGTLHGIGDNKNWAAKTSSGRNSMVRYACHGGSLARRMGWSNLFGSAVAAGTRGESQKVSCGNRPTSTTR